MLYVKLKQKDKSNTDLLLRDRKKVRLFEKLIFEKSGVYLAWNSRELKLKFERSIVFEPFEVPL